MSFPLWVLALASMAIGVYFTLHHPEEAVRGAGMAGASRHRRGHQRRVAGVGDLPASHRRRRIAGAGHRTAAARGAAHGFWVDERSSRSIAVC